MSARAELRDHKRDEMRERAARFLDHGFVARSIVPLVPELARSTRPPVCVGDVVRLKGTGRATIRYEFDGRLTLYGKAYTDGLGRVSYHALRSLWQDGFGRASLCRVPEPLGFDRAENFLLMRQARGTTLADTLFAASPPEIMKAVRKAARWLAALHTSRPPGIETEAPCERVKIFKLADMLAKASAAYPQQATMLLDLVQKIRRVAPSAASTPELAPTHGQYTPANVFLHENEVSVIDLDRICLSDPAKDVAMFVHRVRSLLFKDANDRALADQIAEEFVSEYRRRAPGLLGNLPYYTALFSLKGFAKIAKDRGPEDPARRPLEEFYLREFERYLGADEPAGKSKAADPSYGRREELGRWAMRITASDFVGRHVFPRLRGKGEGEASMECETTVVQDTGTGRLTLRYDFGGDQIVYAKLYTDELGAHSYRIQKALWDGGFGAGSRYQVPEPMAFLEEHNLFLMRGVAGRPLGALLKGEEEPVLLEGMREAARWLAAFHRSTVRIGEFEPDWDSLKIFRLCVRLIKAAAARPGERSDLLDLMHGLKERVRRMPARRPVAQTHGRYHHDHVFIAPGSVSVIDLDRSRPTDPAKDVAEFLRVFRMTSFRQDTDWPRTERATSAFLDEYLSLVPDAALGLPYYWSAFLWLSLFGAAKKFAPGDARGEALWEFHLREMDRALELMR